MKYFAYGSNMSLLRLQQRVPSAARIGAFFLKAHQLRFDKVSKDGSGKCDAFKTNNIEDVVVGAFFEINEDEKGALDIVEGLGHGYAEKMVHVYNDSGEVFDAFTYYAIKIDPSLRPYYWYLNHVIIGAIETNVPAKYLELIQSTECIEDQDKNRDANQTDIYR